VIADPSVAVTSSDVAATGTFGGAPMQHLPALGQIRAEERGASAVEYALTLALIAILIIGAVALFGGSTNGLFQTACESMPSSASC
jgi:Flp pilus assembly pilin Flp